MTAYVHIRVHQCTYLHTCAHIYTTQMHTYVHAHRHTCIFTCVHTHMHTVSKLYMHATHACAYMLIHAHANMYAYSHIHMLVHMYTIYKHMHIYLHVDIPMLACIHTYAHIPRHTFTLDMRTHFPAFISSNILLHFSFPVKPSWQWFSFTCFSAHFSDFHPLPFGV